MATCNTKENFNEMAESYNDYMKTYNMVSDYIKPQVSKNTKDRIEYIDFITREYMDSKDIVSPTILDSETIGIEASGKDKSNIPFYANHFIVDMEKTDNGYRALYLTGSKNQARVTNINNNGKSTNMSFNVNKIKDIYDDISTNKQQDYEADVVNEYKNESIKKPIDTFFDSNGFYTDETIRRITKKDYYTHPSILGATASDQIKFTKENSEIIAADLINDMNKANEILDAIIEFDGIKMSPEHIALLKKNLSELTNGTMKNIPDMIQVINKTVDKNVGQFVKTGSKKGIWVGVSSAIAIAGNQMSAGEKYVHELNHAGLEYAIEHATEKVATALHDINIIYNEFIKVATVDDFLVDINSGNSIDLVEERKVAESLLRYLKNPKTGFNEFIVMSRTNPMVQKVLRDKVVYKKQFKGGKGIWGTLVNAVTIVYDSIYNLMRHSHGLDGLTAMNKFVQEVHAANNLAVQEITKQNALLKFSSDFMNLLNTKTSDIIKYFYNLIRINDTDEDIRKFNDKLQSDIKSINEKHKDGGSISNLIKSVKMLGLLTKMVGRFLLSKQANDYGAFETLLSLTGYITAQFGDEYKSLNPEGDVQQLIQMMRKSDKHSSLVEKLGLESQKSEASAEAMLNVQAEIIKDLFHKPLKDDENYALTRVVVDLQLGSLINEHQLDTTDKQVDNAIEILKDPGKLNEAIEDAKTLIRGIAKTKEEANFMIAQAIGLGEYMVTGKSHSAQLSNAFLIHGIAGQIDSKTISKSNTIKNNNGKEAYISFVARLATLSGLKEQGPELNKKAGEVFAKNKDAVQSVIKYDLVARNEIKESTSAMEYEYDFTEIMGSSEKIGSGWMSAKISRSNNSEKMLDDDYVLNENLTYNQNFDVFINSNSTEATWRNETLDTTNDSSPINSYNNLIKEDMLEVDDMFDLQKTEIVRKKIDADLKRREISLFNEFSKMKKDGYVPSEVGLRPVFKFAAQDKVILSDMDISVDKRQLEKKLSTTNKIESVIAKTFSKAVRLNAGRKVNEKVLDTIEMDMNSNYEINIDRFTGGKNNLMEYVSIGEFETNALNKEIWPIIPRYMKKKIKNMHGRNVAREIAHLADKFNQYTDSQKEKIDKLSNKIKKMEAEYSPDASKINAEYKKLNLIKMNALTDALKKLPESNKEKIEYKEKIKILKESSPHIAVRRNLVYHYFGNREAVLFGSKKRGVFMKKFVKFMKHLDMWYRHLIKITKVTIVVRDITVSAMNILSNFVLAVLQGRNPFSEIKGQIKGFIELDRYLKSQKAVNKLKVKAKAIGLNKKEQDQLSFHIQAMKNNSAAPLINKGLYTSVSEDIANDDLHKETYLDHLFDKYTSKIPEGIKNVGDWLWLTKNTQGFQILLRTMQASDFAARYSRYHYLIQQGKSPDVATKDVIDNQLNYGWGQGKITQWLNARGFIMFSKFGEAIVRPLIELYRQRPFNVIMTFISGGWLLDNGPLLDSIVTKGPLAYIHTPMDMLDTIIDSPFISRSL